MAFTPRLTAPSTSNKYYISTKYGGYDPCILISGNSCIPNCVGYANGRSREISGNKAQMPACNAKDWWTTTGYAKGQTPKLGAVMVWGGTRYGHVAVVEQISNDYVTASMSCYGGERFYLRYFRKGSYDYNGLKFLGFIYNPYAEAADVIPSKPYAVFRLYNPGNGDHFFTADVKEANAVKKAGFSYEGIGWYHDDNGTPVARLYNPHTGEHLYTIDQNEIKVLTGAGWKEEKKAAFGSGKGANVYRLSNPGKKHIFTASTKERDRLIKLGWRSEGVGFRTK